MADNLGNRPIWMMLSVWILAALSIVGMMTLVPHPKGTGIASILMAFVLTTCLMGLGYAVQAVAARRFAAAVVYVLMGLLTLPICIGVYIATAYFTGGAFD